MTLVIALKQFETEKEANKNGRARLCVFSDSKETMGNELISMNRKCRKVYPILFGKQYVGSRAAPLAIWSGAGDSTFLKKGKSICETILKDHYIKEWEKAHPTFDQFGEAVEIIEESLLQKFKEYDKRNLDIALEMILGSVDNSGKVSLYQFNSEGLSEQLHDDPGYAILGCGYLTGANVLLNMLGYDLENSWRFDSHALIAFVIDRVSEIDPAVGWFEGDGYIMWVENDQVFMGPLKENYIRRYQTTSQLRTDMIRYLWSLCDESGDKEVSRKMARLRFRGRA